ncbi:uncharacterized protein HMPREF1541_05238 [Cyphellophora europaea CBS 101466]|uniref:Nudix hydrolase domain-containing protein n=1 Tax=Cyphellophora europaea (strain CBS 101466) TaxID=1220924 RepID=W2RYW6_CYPE1|nr:uncharacterized protein HMPREF1541_05238 [Cyphellophora europaea CBS 101466]ETN40958.1 hypothetical protein HMPREF1541_05238 [Cyphellophora europaea CBS 101466]
MKHRSVVANFIFQSAAPSQPVDAVALFRRSHHPSIRSYQGKLAPISGSIDASDNSPTAAAVRETREETQLIAHRDIRLDFIGPPFSFADEQAQRSWTVYPFAWTLLVDEKAIILDWEHDGWEWAKPENVLSGAMDDVCVPRLHESLRRVYFGAKGMFGSDEHMRPGSEAGNAFQAGINLLRDDKDNGARVLATNAVRSLKEIVDAFPEPADSSTRALWWKSLRIAAYHLMHSARPSMSAAIASALLEALSQIEHMIRDPGQTKQDISSQLDICISNRQHASKRIAQAFTDYLGERAPNSADNSAVHIVTLSSSSTIQAALLHLIGSRQFKKVQVSILESRPRCEGASLAAAIVSALKNQRHEGPLSSSTTVSITIAPDSHLASFIAPTEPSARVKTYLLLGADRITVYGDVLNKTLSLSAASLAQNTQEATSGQEQQRSVPVVVLSESDKVAGLSNADALEQSSARSEKLEREAHGVEAGSVEEVIGIWKVAGVKDGDVELLREVMSEGEGAAMQVSVEDRIFEWVPARLVSVYMTELGRIYKNYIREMSVRKTELAAKIFDDLYD